MDYLYGPLGKDWCLYFYILSVIYFLLIFVAFFLFIRYIMSKNVNYNIAGTMFSTTISTVLWYIQMRILHGMCINSSK